MLLERGRDGVLCVELNLRQLVKLPEFCRFAIEEAANHVKIPYFLWGRAQRYPFHTQATDWRPASLIERASDRKLATVWTALRLRLIAERQTLSHTLNSYRIERRKLLVYWKLSVSRFGERKESQRNNSGNIMDMQAFKRVDAFQCLFCISTIKGS